MKSCCVAFPLGSLVTQWPHEHKGHISWRHIHDMIACQETADLLMQLMSSTWILLSFLSFFLSLALSVFSISVCFSFFFGSFFLSFFLSFVCSFFYSLVFSFFISLCIFFSFLCISLYFFLSFCLSVCLSVCLACFLPSFLSFFLSIPVCCFLDTYLLFSCYKVDPLFLFNPYCCFSLVPFLDTSSSFPCLQRKLQIRSFTSLQQYRQSLPSSTDQVFKAVSLATIHVFRNSKTRKE